MQPWSSTSSRALLFALRPLSRPTERHFSVSATLERTKKVKVGSRDRAEAGKEAKKDAKLSLKSTAQTARRTIAAASDFDHLVETSLQDIKKNLYRLNGQNPSKWSQFERRIKTACQLHDTRKAEGPLARIKLSLRKAYLQSGVHGLREELEYMQYADDLTERYSNENVEAQQEVCDLRHPAEWYPNARSIQRTIHLHVGPTNSGKTYHALQRLKKSKSGFYAGPLRLLAQEVYHRFKDNGIPCSLVTGDEVRHPENGETPRIVSNTVEMVSLGQQFEVGVIDEIQMISDSSRGWAWTRAVLGAQVSELHLCGEVRTVPLIRELCALTGDVLEIHRYERLNALEVMPRSLRGDLKKLQRGDCLVAFSRVGIHALKALIERSTGKRAAIVYGGLPAEIRTQQAALFNDPDNDYDFLVASDAIGMGLNLSCKRVIFETTIKRTPSGLHRLTVPEIKQIGGRAGRYRAANAKGGSDDGVNIGYVTCLEEVDLPYIQEAFGVEPPPLRAAGIVPPNVAFQKFDAYFPRGVPFEYLIKRIIEISQMSPLFFMCDVRNQLENAEIIDSVKGLSIQDQLMLMASPMDTRDQSARNVTAAFADCIAENTRGRLLEIPGLNLEILEQPVSGDKNYVHELESLHKAIILYSWLSFRFGGIFTDRTLATHVKKLVEDRMIRALTEFSANKKLRKDASLKRRIQLQKQIIGREAEFGPEEVQLSDNEDMDPSESDFDANFEPTPVSKEQISSV
ncbi:hypothetical protein N7495_005920 [Penicillium taxi]|uniref:uncharacterized protein n=1 Tax=Penicillium taxi TaxID=168475 RepID=UPI002545410E|nr:uncharacterized protein N7495_005920 [Penicillium taxi]KAJ5894229.1 hypothetical protein N7495_005920 [Penicillium taxi]